MFLYIIPTYNFYTYRYCIHTYIYTYIHYTCRHIVYMCYRIYIKSYILQTMNITYCVYLFVYVSLYLFIYLFAYLFIYLFIFFILQSIKFNSLFWFGFTNRSIYLTAFWSFNFHLKSYPKVSAFRILWIVNEKKKTIKSNENSKSNE